MSLVQTFPPGDRSGGVDTYVSSDGTGTPARTQRNYGISSHLVLAGTTRGLIRFDLSAIPANAICNSAVLSTYQSSSGAALAWTVSVYSVAAANTAWIEGTGNGTVNALAGEPCWNARVADGAGGVTTAWAGTAGLSTSGTDYEAVAIGTFSGNRSDANGTEYTCTLTAARVQAWFGAVNTNYGMLLIPSTNPGGLGASDHPTAAYRPKLVLTYTLAGGNRMLMGIG